MERKINISDKTDKKIREVSEELNKIGLGAFADSYYEDDEYVGPFFKIEKPFLKESEKDPDSECIFLDVGEEYTVHTRLGHEHYNHAKNAVETVKGLFDGTLAEVALCFDTLTARFLIKNTGDPQKNVDKVNENAKAIMELINSAVKVIKGRSHIHQIFEPSFPHCIHIFLENNYMYGGCEVYLQSVVMGTHPEIYMC